jgi:hypothetical protein
MVIRDHPLFDVKTFFHTFTVGLTDVSNFLIPDFLSLLARDNSFFN